jgi:hypothetical protein
MAECASAEAPTEPLPRARIFAMSRGVMRRLPTAIFVSTLAVACSPEPQPAQRSAPPQPAPQPIADAGAWGKRVAAAPSARELASALAPRAALMSDEVEASDELVFAGRLVYRVGFVVPPAFRDHRAVVQAPAGELHIDVSMSRLRARFVGPGWPVEEGAEIRLRGDLLGGYLFDGRGGRSLGSGQLAAWFEGREGSDAQTRVGIRKEYGPQPQRPVPGELVCALLAEWGRQKRESLDHRCSEGMLPPGFRVGPWSGELTAIVPMELPRRTLRADEGDPPAKIAPRHGSAWLEPAVIARLVPARPLADPAPGALVVENQTDTRAIVLAQGVAVGWVDAGQRLRIDGFTPGFYRVGAIRPLGVLRMPPRLVRVPSTIVIGKTE